MKNIIYLKVYKGYIEVRTAGEDNEQKYYSSGLNHPRSLAGDFSEVESTVKDAISKQPKTWFGMFKPAVVIHLVPAAEGGYTMLEEKFFREAVLSSGVSKIIFISNERSVLNDERLYELNK